jgi:hypothetical protein
MIEAFGPRAQRYAAGLGDLDAIVADLDGVGEAYAAAVRRRETGAPFYAMLLLDDPRVSFGRRFAEQILAHNPDYDARRLIFDQLARGELPVDGARIDTRWPLDARLAYVCTEFLGLGDAMLVRSYAEAARLAQSFAQVNPRRQVRPIERILAAGDVPVVTRVRPERPCVVVWGPQTTARECALALHGLSEFHGELVCVSSGGPRPARIDASFLAPGDAPVRAVLGRAAAVVCVDHGDPADAVAFARLGYGVVAPITSGAHEFAGTVVVWDALDARALFTAVAVAIARPATVHTEPARPPRAPRGPQRPAFAGAEVLPLVSIVTPTYNRRDELRRMLSCLAAQTYPNIEAVIVNDGGEAIDDIVAAFPFARLIEQPANAGALRAVERGRRLARGEYIGLLPDDDWLFPDHIERLVDALVRSGASVAHGCSLIRYLEREPDGSWQTTGFNNRTFAQTLTPTEALICSTLGGHQMLVHRSVYDTAGGYLLDSDVSDNEIHMRFTQRYFYAFADNVTCEFRDHSGGQGRQCDFAGALQHIYDAEHPVPGRPALERLRDATIVHIRQRPPGQPAFPRTLVVAKQAR